jgi:O-antigen/teichoic acid export membrane protein
VTEPGIAARLRARLHTPKPSVRRNVVANFVATGWAAILGIVVVPLNVRFIGIEGYAVIGVYAMVQALSLLLDSGLSPTLNRELAQRSAAGYSASDTRTLVRTLEIVYWGVALLVGLVVVGLAPVAARYWLHPERLSVSEVQRALMLMGLTIAIQWPASFYASGVQGLQRQVELSAGNVVMGTLRSVGGVLVLWLVSPTIGAFFIWQALVSALWTGWLGWFLWRRLPAADGHRARFDASHLRRVWRFAAGVNGMALTGMALSQSDKLILSHILPLEQFGYYSLAATVASVFGRSAEPIGYAFFPRFSELHGRGEERQLVATYHRACQLLSVVVLPAAVVLTLFSSEVLQLWTHNPVIVTEAHWLLTLLVAATAFNRLLNLPAALQLAYGWTSLTLWNNAVAIALLIPSLIAATQQWGAIGAASVLAILNLVYVLVHIPLMHRRIAVGEAKRWFLEDVAAPLLAAIAVAVPGTLVMRGTSSALGTLLVLIAVSAGSLLAGALSVPWLRETIARVLSRSRFAAQT